MRLIDADAFLEYFDIGSEDAREENRGEIITAEDIDNFPTAYDMDNVVEQLNAHKDCYELKAASYDECGDTDNMEICDYISLSYGKAIEIVKSGCIE